MMHSCFTTATSAGLNLRILGDLLLTDIREAANSPQRLSELLHLMRNFYQDIVIYTESMKYPLESYQVMRDYFYLLREERQDELAEKYLQGNLKRNPYLIESYKSLQSFCDKIENAKPINRALKLLLVLYLALSVPILRYEDMTDSEDFEFYAKQYIETSPRLRWNNMLHALEDMDAKQIINKNLNNFTISLLFRSGLDARTEFRRIISFPAKGIYLFIKSLLDILKRGIPQFLETGIPDSMSNLFAPPMASFLFPNQFNLMPDAVDKVRKWAFSKRKQTPTSILDILSRVWAFYHVPSGLVLMRGDKSSVRGLKWTAKQNYLPYKLEGALGLSKRTQTMMYCESLTRNLLLGDFTCPLHDLLFFDHGELHNWPDCDGCPYKSNCKNLEMER